MSLHSLLYVSRSRIAPQDAEQVVRSIIDTALARNPQAGLTGALLFTGTHFAQVLEGEGDAIDRLMERVARDQRHDQPVIIDRGPLDQRRFPEWSMVYYGPSQFVGRHVTRLLDNPSGYGHRPAGEWLTDLMREFSAA